MREMDRRIALLRLLMVEIGDRERQAQQAAEQLRTQLPRIVDFAVRHNTSVSTALSSLADVEARLREQEEALQHLGLLRERARSELDALLVTRGVTDAHARLAELEAQRARLIAARATPDALADAQARDPELATIEGEIDELRAAIQTASEAAARALTSHAPLHVASPHDDLPPGQTRHSEGF